MLNTIESPAVTGFSGKVQADSSTVFSGGNAASLLPDLPSKPLSGKQIAFVDSSLAHFNELVAALENVTLYQINAEQDGVSYIGNVLAQLSGQSHDPGNAVNSVHIFSHGRAGALQLGSTTLTVDNLNGYSDALSRLAQSQTGDVLLYGCDVAKGNTGNAFIEQMARLSGADIQASSDVTGNAQLGGDWDLEVGIGNIETGLAISALGQTSYQGTLASPEITSNGGGATATTVVTEGSRVVTDVSTLGANGYREGFGLEYYFSGGQDSYLFDIDVNTGVVSFKNSPSFVRPLDVGRNNVYDINILAIDWTGQSDTQALSVTVQKGTSVNPFQLVNSSGGSLSNIAVNEGGRAAIDLGVTGAASGFSEGNGIEYYFQGGQDAYLFNLDANTGVLTFKDAPDYEKPLDGNRDNRYEVGVMAIDYAGQSDTKVLSIAISDVTEGAGSAPVITSSGGGAYATAQVQEGDRTVVDMAVTDADGQTEGNGITYSIEGGIDSRLFSIDANTGVLTFKATPDFEAPADANGDNIYGVEIFVADATGRFDSQFIDVRVTNVVEGTSPVITSGGGGDTALIQVKEGTRLAVDMQASDAEGDREGSGITYRINAGEDAALFEIDPNTGVISFKLKPDYESPLDHDLNNLYRINVLAFDSTGRADSQFIQLQVTNRVSVYLLGGQSNMAGETSNASFLAGTPQGNPLPAVQIWQPGFNSFVDLRPGFQNNFGVSTGFGAEIGFGHTLEAARASGQLDNEEIYLVKYAIGATTLAVDWNVDGTGNRYDDFTQWVGGALANLASAGLDYTIEGMLWMQGENDAINAAYAASYQSNLTNLIADVRSRYGANMDFVIGRLHEELAPFYYTEANVVRTAQATVAQANPRNYLVNTDGLTVNPVDGVHFDSSGHLALGVAFANVFIR